MIWGVLSWLVRSKVGRWLALAGIALIGAAFTILSLINTGRKIERTDQMQKGLRNLRERVKKDDEIRKMPNSDVRDKLRSEWMRDD